MNNAQMNTQTQTQPTAHVLTKAKWETAVKEFKAFLKDKGNMPYHDTYGTKHPGNINLPTFVFYALLRDKDPLHCTHDALSEKYTDALTLMNSMSKKEVHGWAFNDHYSDIKACFPSLTEDDIAEVIKGSLNI